MRRPSPAHRATAVVRPAGARGVARAAAPLLTGLLAASLVGCSGSTVEAPAAEDATDPGCAAVLVLLREVGDLGGLPRVASTGQSTAAWASADRSRQVVLRCGVPLPGPTTDACLSVDGVDWVASDPEGGPPWTTYGRAPATEVAVVGDVPAADVLPGLGGAVSALEPQRACS
ncbi:DUF3515 family protein [uncultured Pseudokineococcus sp.]|uniref:DUF3515 family protein n=1 Tax=uncultured Pseudokineococcus sp. TaxID=1642928 RepID=UPI002631D46B|nr:DUF3515 family protein [uncultured Pseudokineococcus sp.]